MLSSNAVSISSEDMVFLFLLPLPLLLRLFLYNFWRTIAFSFRSVLKGELSRLSRTNFVTGGDTVSIEGDIFLFRL